MEKEKLVPLTLRIEHNILEKARRAAASEGVSFNSWFIKEVGESLGWCNKTMD